MKGKKMSIPAFPITSTMAEMGVVHTALLLTSWDEDEGKLYMEAAVHVERKLPLRQCEDLRDICKGAANAAANVLALVIAQWLRSENVSVDVSFVVYVDDEGR